MTTTTLTGSTIRLDRSDLAKLTHPRAWQISAEEAARRDAVVSDFVVRAERALVEHGDACAVEIERDAVERALAGDLGEIEILFVVGNDDEE